MILQVGRRPALTIGRIPVLRLHMEKPMKKSLLALAVVAGFAGAAHAQAPASTSVTLYGLLDVGVGITDPETGSTTTALVSGVQSGSRWGLKGSEDLGGGLKAIFQLENGFNVDNGTLGQGGRLFGRWAYAGLAGSFGEVRLGRQWAAGFELAGLVDPFGTGFGAAGMQSTFSSANALRVDNALVYRSPVVGGFLGVVGYSFNAVAQESGSASANPNALTLGGAYLNGPLAVIGTYENVNNPTGGKDQKHWWVGGTYDLKVVKLAAAYGQDKDQFTAGPYSFGTSADSKQFMLGATAPIGAGSLFGSYQSRDDKSAANKDGAVIGVGYTHPLSKRTNVYTYFADSDGKKGNDGKDFREFAVGLRHTF